jgi:hypothetical protein
VSGGIRVAFICSRAIPSHHAPSPPLNTHTHHTPKNSFQPPTPHPPTTPPHTHLPHILVRPAPGPPQPGDRIGTPALPLALQSGGGRWGPVWAREQQRPLQSGAAGGCGRWGRGGAGGQGGEGGLLLLVVVMVCFWLLRGWGVGCVSGYCNSRPALWYGSWYAPPQDASINTTTHSRSLSLSRSRLPQQQQQSQSQSSPLHPPHQKRRWKWEWKGPGGGLGGS